MRYCYSTTKFVIIERLICQGCNDPCQLKEENSMPLLLCGNTTFTFFTEFHYNPSWKQHMSINGRINESIAVKLFNNTK